MFKNRRRHQRYPITVQVSVRFGDTFLDGTECSDISLGGMCVVVNEEIEKNWKYGTVMLVQKYGDETIVFESNFTRLWDNHVYVNRKDTRIGIKFRDIDSTNFNNLCKLISYQSSP